MKHACLIMIHNNYEQVWHLLSLLDSDDNDIYVHVDAKSKFEEDDKKYLISSVKKAKIHFVQRISVGWGGFSQIRVEQILLSEAVKEYHDYYHLLSGADLPLKPWKKIDDFFLRNRGKEFVNFMKPDSMKKLQKRSRYYWLFQETIGDPKKLKQTKNVKKCLLFILQRSFVLLQKTIGINRTKDMPFSCGANWFSITDDFANYVVENEKWVFDTFKNTLCCDEVFLQTLLVNSPYYKNIYRNGEKATWQEANQRMVDWGRGRPYVFRKTDYDELVKYPYCFARKFDWKIDKDIIQLLYEKNQKEGTL